MRQQGQLYAKMTGKSNPFDLLRHPNHLPPLQFSPNLQKRTRTQPTQQLSSKQQLQKLYNVAIRRPKKALSRDIRSTDTTQIENEQAQPQLILPKRNKIQSNVKKLPNNSSIIVSEDIYSKQKLSNLPSPELKRVHKGISKTTQNQINKQKSIKGSLRDRVGASKKTRMQLARYNKQERVLQYQIVMNHKQTLPILQQMATKHDILKQFLGTQFKQKEKTKSANHSAYLQNFKRSIKIKQLKFGTIQKVLQAQNQVRNKLQMVEQNISNNAYSKYIQKQQRIAVSQQQQSSRTQVFQNEVQQSQDQKFKKILQRMKTQLDKLQQLQTAQKLENGQKEQQQNHKPKVEQTIPSPRAKVVIVNNRLKEILFE